MSGPKLGRQLSLIRLLAILLVLTFSALLLSACGSSSSSPSSTPKPSSQPPSTHNAKKLLAEMASLTSLKSGRYAGTLELKIQNKAVVSAYAQFAFNISDTTTNFDITSHGGFGPFGGPVSRFLL